MMGTWIHKVLGNTWFYIVLLFGSVGSIYLAAGHATQTSYFSGSWQSHLWWVAFGLAAGAGAVSVYVWNWTRLFEVALLSVITALAFYHSTLWTATHYTLLWFGLAALAVLVMLLVIRKPKAEDSPTGRMVAVMLYEAAFGVFACVFFWSVTTFIIALACFVGLMLVALVLTGANTKPAPAYARR